MFRNFSNARCFPVLALVLAFFASLSVCTMAQTSGAGAIAGTVTDANQAVLPGVSVTVTNTDTGIARIYTTNSAGLYLASFLKPGHYKVDASGPNLGTVEAKNLNLLVGQTLTIDLSLAVKSTATTVEVSSSTPILDPEQTEVSQVVDQDMIENLPVAARNWSSFVLLTPAVVQDGGSGMISFHGISGLYNQNYVDGANNNQMLFAEARGRSSGAPYVYSIDSIKEFQAETSNYSVEFGQAAGGQVNAITKSGGNMLHGDLFYFLRYPDLNALDPISKYTGLHSTNTTLASALLTQPVHQQNQFGGSIGGPAIKDKLFYFLTVDGFRKVGRALYYNTNTITTTPTAENSGNTIISPTQCPTTITSTQCLAGINFLLSVGEVAPSRYAKQNLFFPRLDWHINQKNDAFVDFNFADFDSTNGYSPNPTYSGSSPTTNGPTSYHERFLVGGLTTTISDRSVNQIHAQWGRDLETAGANAAAPNVSMGPLSYGMPNALPRVAEPDEHRIQFTDVFSHVMGRQTLKFGGDINVVHEVMINLFSGGGLYAYSGNNPTKFGSWIADAFAGQAGDTDPYAGYHYFSLLQVADVINTAPGTQGKDDFWMKMYDGFVQDTWNVNRKLTINAGIRYDFQQTPPPSKVNTGYAPISTYYTQTIKNVSDRVAPRVGFSYSLFPGTVIRGGYGLYTALNQGSTYYAMRVENGVYQINYNYSGCGGTCGATFNPNSTLRFPNVPFLPPGPALSSAVTPVGGTIPTVSGLTGLSSAGFHGLDPNFVPPYSHEMELAVEQALPGKMSLSLGYIGTRGMRLPVFLDAQLIGQTPHGVRSYNVLDANNNVVRQMTVPVYLTTDRSYQSATTPLSSFNTGFSIANTWYNAMAATVRRPFANGVEILANYTWAHASDDGQVAGTFGTFYGGDTPLDPNNIRLENGPSDTEIRNRFTLSFLYQPTFHLQNFTLRNAVNGWSFSGSEIASGGQPVSLAVTGDNIATSSTFAEGGIYGGAMSSGGGTATNGRPPYIGRNTIPMPGFNDLDLRIKRKFQIHDQMYLEFVGEAFNALNHTIVTGVASTYANYYSSSSTGSAGEKTCAATSAAPSGSTLQGCFSPYIATGTSAFNTISNSNNGLYGPRQLQVSAKFSF